MSNNRFPWKNVVLPIYFIIAIFVYFSSKVAQALLFSQSIETSIETSIEFYRQTIWRIIIKKQILEVNILTLCIAKKNALLFKGGNIDAKPYLESLQMRSVQIPKNHQKSPKITKNHKKSPKVTKNQRKSPKIKTKS